MKNGGPTAAPSCWRHRHHRSVAAAPQCAGTGARCSSRFISSPARFRHPSGHSHWPRRGSRCRPIAAPTRRF